MQLVLFTVSSFDIAITIAIVVFFFLFFSACLQQNGFLEGFWQPSTSHELPNSSSAMQC